MTGSAFVKDAGVKPGGASGFSGCFVGFFPFRHARNPYFWHYVEILTVGTCVLDFYFTVRYTDSANVIPLLREDEHQTALSQMKRKDRYLMEKLEQLYEGKAKKVFKTEDPDVLIVDYKDDATAFNGEKKGTIVGKGVINNKMSNHVDKLLEKEGVPTHYIEELSDRETAVKKVEIVPLEVIIRNVAAGSFSKRLGVPEGTPFDEPTIEFSYKNDELGDPLINSYFAVAMKLATWEEIETIKKYAFKVNEVLKAYFLQADIKLIDFKIEFGRYHDQIILADEISPDTCRLWDVHTNEKLDKDRFRRDLGNVEEAYNEVFHRLGL